MVEERRHEALAARPEHASAGRPKAPVTRFRTFNPSTSRCYNKLSFVSSLLDIQITHTVPDQYNGRLIYIHPAIPLA